MPWAIFNRPSIQLGALKAFLDHHATDLDVQVFHPYLGAAAKIGLDHYRVIAEDSWAGEALYCALLFPEMHAQAARVFTRSLNKHTAKSLPDFELLCKQLDDHLNSWLETTSLKSCRLVGFSVCFAQLPASLLAAQRLKKLYPAIKIVLGGSTCVPRIGASLLQAFPAIDYIAAGEGEQSLLNLCQYLKGTIQNPGPGILLRENKDSTAHLPARELSDLNVLPVPDYDDYFAEMQESGLFFIPQLPVEFSRGCWWNKCRFCNLNLQWCGYRHKTHDRMLQEVDHLRLRHRCLDFPFTDNALPPAAAESFFRASARAGNATRFFAEIRTINIPEHYKLYRQGGIHSVQVGIESLSNSLLKRMNKGATVMDNLMAMKLCAENNIQLEGNLITGFPGSTEQEVRETLHALDFALPYSPLSTARFFLGHGSQVWQDPAGYGIRNIRHHPNNRLLYPAHILNQLDMLIMQETGTRGEQQKLWQPVRAKVKAWHKFHSARTGQSKPLAYRDGDEFIIIRQERPDKPVQHHRLSGISRRIYLACTTPVGIKSLLTTFNSVTEKGLQTFLADLEKKKLLFRDGDLCLALAVKE